MQRLSTAIRRTASVLAASATVLLLFGCGGYTDGYQKVNGKWAYVTWATASGRKVIPIKGADQQTFEVLAADRYAKDKNRVYYQTQPIPKADPASFRVIQGREGYCYARDKSHVFLQDLIVREAEPETFEVLTFPYSRDRTRAFCGTLLMPVDDADSFQVLHGDSLMTRNSERIAGSGWAMDGVSVFYGREKVPGVDVGSFQALNEGYGKDKHRVYYGVNVVPRADPATFETTGLGTGHDKNRRFALEKPLPKE